MKYPPGLFYPGRCQSSEGAKGAKGAKAKAPKEPKAESETTELRSLRSEVKELKAAKAALEKQLASAIETKVEAVKAAKAEGEKLGAEKSHSEHIRGLEHGARLTPGKDFKLQSPTLVTPGSSGGSSSADSDSR